MYNAEWPEMGSVGGINQVFDPDVATLYHHLQTGEEKLFLHPVIAAVKSPKLPLIDVWKMRNKDMKVGLIK